MTEESDSRIKYLDEGIVKDLCHEMACRLFQQEEPMGLYEDHDSAKLDSCLNLPKQAVFGKELYPGVFRKAAITFYAFNRNHAFGNGNKRLSVATLVVFLFMNDQILKASTTEMRDKALWLAQVDEPIADVVEGLTAWIQERCVTSEELKRKYGSVE